MSGVERIAWHRLMSRRRWVVGDMGFAAAAMCAQLFAITVASLASGVVYHLVKYGDVGPLASFAAVGTLAALLYVLPYLTRDEYRIATFIERPRPVDRIVTLWGVVFLELAIIAFLAKATALFSRGWIVLFCAVGLVAVLAVEALTRRALTAALASGLVARRRLMLVGTDDELRQYATRRRPDDRHEQVVAVARLPDASREADLEATPTGLAASLERGVMTARVHNVEDILLLSGGRDPHIVDKALAAFSLLPVAVHCDAGPVFDRFASVRVGRTGTIASIALTDAPLNTTQALVKRVFDILIAALALVPLAPVFLIVAALVKLDSKGPVFFLQRRHGYNQREFRIFKFRTMSTMDDGDTIPQACRNDPRVTRVGAFLRRWNIDELPQVLNVLRGEMSVVGPRPHAVAHDRMFEKRITRYARRLNVKPGITGWAQVNGHRGETDTDEKMQARVEHDLHYIDNWSVWFDIYILMLTVFSRKAFRNAL